MALSDVRAEDVAKASDIDFSKPTQAIFTLSDGNVLTLTGTAIGDKRWIEIQATKDAALAAKTQNRAFEVASYKYDAIFRPLDELLVPKETKPPREQAGRSEAAARQVRARDQAGRSIQVTHHGSSRAGAVTRVGPAPASGGASRRWSTICC